MNGTMILYTVAYCLFLYGAARSFQTGGSAGAVRLMCGAIVLDISASSLPQLGLPFLPRFAVELNRVLIAAIVLGGIVWLLFAGALLVRRAGHANVFQNVIITIEILWFVDFMLFLYGMYAVPVLQSGG